ncbi:MAG: radical SAM protein [bacterium]
MKRRVEALSEHLRACSLCPRKCGVNRLNGKVGFCRAGAFARVFTSLPHFGEEPPISGKNGSGVIFFSRCTGRCLYCQNWPMSREGRGEDLTIPQLSDLLLRLQEAGCHNVNLVSPTPYLPQVMSALEPAVERGFNLPLVYNTSGYEAMETLKLLEGTVDIYLADMRYGDDAPAERYSALKNYVKINRAAVREMHRQAGLLKCEDGIARRGLIIRHLILPNGLAGTKAVLGFIREELSPETHVSLMSQYFPFFKAKEELLLDRPISHEEYEEACRFLYDSGLENGWIQDEMDGETRRKYSGESFSGFPAREDDALKRP